LNREDLEDREENIYCGLRGNRFCRIMRWIPSLMRVTFQLTARALNELTYFFFVVFAVFAAQNAKPNQRHNIQPHSKAAPRFQRWSLFS
jgi:hypothetical protein